LDPFSLTLHEYCGQSKPVTTPWCSFTQRREPAEHTGSTKTKQQKNITKFINLALNTELSGHNAGEYINFIFILTDFINTFDIKYFYADLLELNDLKIWKIVHQCMHVCIREL
jgi:hypothetical protein